ncbi:hypothetical protein B0O95_102179 [Mycetohabitans endofungorum]|uniref:Uncharacterized protein n=2 Tax=Burkholderiaceae TaxID=119060 RepID=A0A2P5KDJ9_9BURK|nr:hypothetical protein B0O95_102179 [Mycetohabitans endofungorum]
MPTIGASRVPRLGIAFANFSVVKWRCEHSNAEWRGRGAPASVGVERRNTMEQSDKPLSPGDEAAPDAPGVGEAICQACHGTGTVDGARCTVCSGTGKVLQGVGGG